MEPNRRILDPQKQGNVKGIKVALEQVMKAQRGSRGIAILFL
jgi:hypothetical protein